jgi:sulfate adenylyltransferase subunit 2
VIRELHLEAVLSGIRRDEHGIRAKERYFSPRDQDSRWDFRRPPPELWDLYASAAEEVGHLRIHPLLHLTELDIWRYIEREQTPGS